MADARNVQRGQRGQENAGSPADAQGETKIDPNAIIFLAVEPVDNDGVVALEELEHSAALLSPFLQRELSEGRGNAKQNPIILPKQVTTDVYELLAGYCRYHAADKRSDKERKAFDERYIRIDTKRLCELTSAADALDMKPLVDLASRALARLIEGKTPEQIRATFHLPDDLTEEEKLEPIKNLGEDMRIRLLNRLYAKRRKELAGRKGEADGPPEKPSKAQVAQETRSVDELLSFIEADQNGKADARGSKPTGAAAAAAKPKRKRSKKKAGVGSPDAPGEPAVSSGDLAGDVSHAARESSPTWSRNAVPAYTDMEPPDLSEQFSDNDSDVDTEINNFSRRLESDWEVRRREILDLSSPAPEVPDPPRMTTLTSLAGFMPRTPKPHPDSSAAMDSSDAAADSPPHASPEAEPALQTRSHPAAALNKAALPNGSVTAPVGTAAVHAATAAGVEEPSGEPSQVSTASDRTGAADPGSQLPRNGEPAVTDAADSLGTSDGSAHGGTTNHCVISSSVSRLQGNDGSAHPTPASAPLADRKDESSSDAQAQIAGSDSQPGQRPSLAKRLGRLLGAAIGSSSGKADRAKGEGVAAQHSPAASLQEQVREHWDSDEEASAGTRNYHRTASAPAAACG
ncbi:hypothetical protein WJX73_002808 [Symbiochloris irregularis]|uniref:SKP1 component dimerisation domain-containing protein n=1 Tax=Symbiochloris irregularis TaxID=706552 RepID=A0AAW1PN79_9CHLO